MFVHRILFFLIIVFIFNFFSSSAIACFSITDDLNSPNPVINADFNILPDVAPFTQCWKGAIRIRSSRNSWRLIANRTGPNPISVDGDPSENVQAKDITLDFEVKNFGSAPPNGTILVSPFSSSTNLSSIQYGTLVLSGIDRTGNCNPSNPNFYKLTKTLCLFNDFVFNIGNYNGQLSFLLVAP